MPTLQTEIAQLEERLRLAELGPDSRLFDEALDDEVVVVSQNAQYMSKARIVEAHQAGKGPKFNSVELSDMKIVDHGTAAVVTCQGTYEGPQWNGTLKFMRVWLKKKGRWRIIASSISQ